MDQHVVSLLQETINAEDTTRRQAENQLEDLYNNADFAPTLCTLAASEEAPLPIRQSALLVLKNFILAGWSDSFDEFRGDFLVPDPARKSSIRDALLNLVIAESAPRKIQNAASLVVSKIASADYPDEWPDILSRLLQNITQAGPNSVHGSLKVLAELVEEGFDQDQFFQVALDLSQMLRHVAISDAAALRSRSLAVCVFRGCFDLLEMVLEDHKTEVKQFAEKVVGEWMPFLLHTTQSRLSERPQEVDSDGDYAGLIKLKIQVMKTLMRIRVLFPSLVSPQGQPLFQATWDDLLSFRDSFERTYIQDDAEGRLEDADGMPYTLDFLVLEEIDFLRAIIGSPNIKKALEQRLKYQSQRNWIVDLLDVVVPYSQMTNEEEGMWEIDVNVFLSEETSVTANYTARTACGDLAIKIGEWLPDSLIEALLTYMSHAFSQDVPWRRKEAVLCILGHVLDDWKNFSRHLEVNVTSSLLEYTTHAMENQQNPFLTARGFATTGLLAPTAKESFHPTAASLLQHTISTIGTSKSETVQVSCIRAIECYLEALSTSSTQPEQFNIINALTQFLSTRDPSDLTESDDLILSLLETLRETLKIDVQICIHGNGLDLLFQIASTLSSGFTVIGSVNETFEEICEKIQALGPELYTQFANKVTSNLLGAFNVGGMTEQEALVGLAADMLANLTSNATAQSLPSDLVPIILPKILPLLLTNEEPDILKPCTSSIRHILTHSPNTILSWTDPATTGPTANKSGLECVLLVIDRLLRPDIDEPAAVEVGYLASSLVTAAGDTSQLTPYLPQLLQAIALRLNTASRAALIQSLILVFARLSLTAAKDVVDFLATLSMPSPSSSETSSQHASSANGLEVIIPKWLENASDFAGYDDIRVNVVALARLYELHDPRLEAVQCKGDLIVERSERIMTRSRAKNVPQRYTYVGAGVKIVKVLVEELGALEASNANAGLGVGGPFRQNGGSAASGGGAANGTADDSDDDEEDEDGDWEDDPGAGVLDLGLPGTREQLMGLGGGGGEEGEFRIREKDDETQGFLVGWFRERGREEGFRRVFEGLSEGERGKLGGLG